jgi:hypothetical protein
MTRSLPVPLIAVALLALVSTGSRASGLPSAGNSTAPAVIRLVGAIGGVPDAVAGQFTIVMRDLANNPMFFKPVWIDLSSCPDLVICSDQMDPNTITNCTAKTVQKLTNASGEVTFTLLGGSSGAGHASSLAQNGKIFGGAGVLFARPSVASFDLDGTGGVGAGDLAVWLSDFGSGTDWARSDYDGDGRIGAGDLSAWLLVFAAGGSAQSCAASCP